MSLRAFHLFFIVVSIALAGFVGAWAFETRPAGGVLFGTASFAVGVFLIGYFFWFLRKMKRPGTR